MDIRLFFSKIHKLSSTDLLRCFKPYFLVFHGHPVYATVPVNVSVNNRALGVAIEALAFNIKAMHRVKS